MSNFEKDISRFYEILLAQLKTRNKQATQFKDLNVEGAEAYQNSDASSLAIHISNYSAVIHLLRRFFPQASQQKFLELGCGSGLFSTCFSKSLPARQEIVAYDYNEDLITYAKQTFSQPGIAFRHCDALALPPELIKTADIVFYCELWEHLTEKEQIQLLNRLHQNLREGPSVFFTTPDFSPYKRQKSNYYPHKKESTYQELKIWLENKENNPFSDYQVFRLINAKLTKDLVFLADNFGYYFNTIYKVIYRLSLKHAFTKTALNLLNASYYKILRNFKQTKIPKEYFETSLVDSNSPEYDKSSFSLVVKLER